MIKHARPAANEKQRQRHEEQRKRGFIPVPPIGDMPIIVATRMSLSFPILFSAVPLHMADYRQADGDDAIPPKLEPCWFSDGGLSSNFPITLFDAPLPRWPTFAISLDDFPPNITQSTDQSNNVMMPKTNGSGILRPFKRFDDIFGFLASIIAAMQGWSDSTQAVLPGYRDRIVTVFLGDGEGGLNLDMPSPLLKDLCKRGAAAGKLIATRFSDAAGSANTERMNWRNHRWLRLRTLFGALQAYLEEYLDSYEPASDEWGKLVCGQHTSYGVSRTTAMRMLQLLRDLRTLGSSFEASAGLNTKLPQPPPDLVLRPDLSSTT
jgi:hypothetical protein